MKVTNSETIKGSHDGQTKLVLDVSRGFTEYQVTVTGSEAGIVKVEGRAQGSSSYEDWLVQTIDLSQRKTVVLSGVLLSKIRISIDTPVVFEYRLEAF